jgi:hypothetical protein
MALNRPGSVAFMTGDLSEIGNAVQGSTRLIPAHQFSFVAQMLTINPLPVATNIPFWTQKLP